MINFAEILAAAHVAAARAQAQRGMVENPLAFDCGFAWVTISGTEPLARYAKKQATVTNDSRYFGSKGYPSGWQWWCPGDFAGQSIGIHEAGAKAFRDALGHFNIRAEMHSRLD